MFNLKDGHFNLNLHGLEEPNLPTYLFLHTHINLNQSGWNRQ